MTALLWCREQYVLVDWSLRPCQKASSHPAVLLDVNTTLTFHHRGQAVGCHMFFIEVTEIKRRLGHIPGQQTALRQHKHTLLAMSFCLVFLRSNSPEIPLLLLSNISSENWRNRVSVSDNLQPICVRCCSNFRRFLSQSLSYWVNSVSSKVVQRITHVCNFRIWT